MEKSVKLIKIKYEERDIKTNIVKIQRILRTYFKNLYSTKVESLKEMKVFLGMYNLPQLSQYEMNNLNRPVTTSELEITVQNF